MTEQINVPKLRFGEFEGEWSPVPLADLTSYLKGFAFKSEDFLNSGQTDSRLIRVSDLSSGAIKLDNQKVFLPSELIESSTRYKLRNEDVLITTVGSKPELRDSAVGRAIYIDKAQGYLNQNLLIMRTKGEQSSRFIFSQLNTPRYINHITNIQRGNANQSNITVPDLFEYRVSTTSLPEQQKIASFLSKVDEKIALLTEKKDKLTEYKKGVMQQLFNGRWEEQQGQLTFIPPTLRFKADDGSEFPDWEEKKGEELFTSVSNKNHNSDLPVLAITQNQGAIPRDLIDYTIAVAEASVASYKVVEKGDFIISLRSFQGGIEYSKYTGICSPAYVILRPKFNISDYFYKYYLKTYLFIVEMQKRLEGIRDGKIISYKYFSEISIPYPTVAEQTKIANFLSTIDQKIDLANSELEKAKQWKKGLLQQMFV